MHEHKAEQKRSKWKWIVICFIILAAVLILAGRRVNLLGAWPYLLILVCPLLHLFMHKGHGHDHDDGK
ncbi:MAG: DUF2933 domain-containing protein [Parcubacteria group bacterium]|nr:DUF2933 domain-containing protein [Parcubacteria group bacterium]